MLYAITLKVPDLTINTEELYWPYENTVSDYLYLCEMQSM